MKKKLVKCRNCYTKDKVVRTLCEVVSPGTVVIRRMKSKEGKENTIVMGKDFRIICSYCGETVYMHERKH